jgi:hypothetical protein
MNNIKIYKSALIYNRLSKLNVRKKRYKIILGDIESEYLRMRYILFLWM